MPESDNTDYTTTSDIPVPTVMSRPGQPGSMQFDRTNITEFLEDWNIECKDYDLFNAQKSAHFPKYCTPHNQRTCQTSSQIYHIRSPSEPQGDILTA